MLSDSSSSDDSSESDDNSESDDSSDDDEEEEKDEGEDEGEDEDSTQLLEDVTVEIVAINATNLKVEEIEDYLRYDSNHKRKLPPIRQSRLTGYIRRKTWKSRVR